MANTFIKATVINRTALGLLEREIVLPTLVWMNGIGDFAGAYNDTINLRVPGRATARKKALRATGNDRNITLDTITELNVPVQLTDDVYSAVPITDEEMTLDFGVESLGKVILVPQVRAVAETLEAGIAEEMQSATYETTVWVDASTDGGTWNGYVDGRKALNKADVAMGDRLFVGGAGFEAALLKDPQFNRYDHSGDANNSAVRDATIGRIGTTEFVTSNALRDGEAYLFHRSAFIFANRAPVVPAGVPFGASESFGQLAMRWIRDYDAQTLTDRSVVNSYAGYAHVADPGDGFVRAVRLLLKVTSIDVTPSSATIVGTGTRQLKVTDSNGFDVTSTATYASSATSKATVNSAGLVTGVAAGTSTITATYQPLHGGSTVTDTCAITVS